MKNKKFIEGMILECTGVELSSDTYSMDQLENNSGHYTKGHGYYLVIKNDRGNLGLMHLCSKSNHVNVPILLINIISYIETDVVYHVEDVNVPAERFRGILIDDIMSVKSFIETITMLHWSHDREVMRLVHDYTIKFFMKYGKHNTYQKEHINRPIKETSDKSIHMKYGASVHISYDVLAWKEQEDNGRQMMKNDLFK